MNIVCLNMTKYCILYFNTDLENVPRFSALEEISDEEAIQIVVPHALPPASFSLRDYVDKSETLTKLVQLGTATSVPDNNFSQLG